MDKSTKFSRPSEEDYEEASNLFEYGRNSIDSHEIAELELRLEQNQYDSESRALLLGYALRSSVRAERTEIYFDHLEWLVKRAPNDPVLLAAFSCPGFQSRRYRDILKLWCHQVTVFPNDITVLDHAASFWSLRGLMHSEHLWRHAQKLEPTNPKWLFALFRVYRSLSSLKRSMKRRSEYVDEAISLGKGLVKLLERNAESFGLGNFVFHDFIEFCLCYRKTEDAEFFIQEAANQGCNANWILSYLGRVQLVRGNISEAENMLEQMPRAQELSNPLHFWPELKLANELLFNESLVPVTSYLNRCKVLVQELIAETEGKNNGNLRLVESKLAAWITALETGCDVQLAW